MNLVHNLYSSSILDNLSIDFDSFQKQDWPSFTLSLSLCENEQGKLIKCYTLAIFHFRKFVLTCSMILVRSLMHLAYSKMFSISYGVFIVPYKY